MVYHNLMHYMIVSIPLSVYIYTWTYVYLALALCLFLSRYLSLYIFMYVYIRIDVYTYIHIAGGQQFGPLALKGKRQNPIPLESCRMCFSHGIWRIRLPMPWIIYFPSWTRFRGSVD